MTDSPTATGGRLVLDVGANTGQFALEVARRNPGLSVVAVEPVPELADGIRRAATEADAGGVSVVETALGPEPGRSVLHVAAVGDWGVSSLLDLEPGRGDDEYWSSREDLEFTGEQTVDVRTLADLLIELQPEVVDFIKIDVQGLDLEVLASAGSQLHLVRAGMLEVPSVARTRLYAQEEATLAGALAFLDEHGFEVYAVKPNDPATNEVNVYFVRRGEDPADVERDLDLRGVPLYDGKHFWARPAATMQEVRDWEERGTAQDVRAAELEARVAELGDRVVQLEAEVEQARAQEESSAAESVADPAADEADPHSVDALRTRLAVMEAELARYHESLGVAPAAAAREAFDGDGAVSTADLLARWAESSREVEKLRRTSDVLAERERRAVLALRNARDELAAARDREDGFQERTTELRSEIRRMHETLGWRLVEPLRAGRRLLARGVRARGIDQA